jgi:hypothetical protein
MRTRIEGHNKNSICITTDGEQSVIDCENCIVKIWLSSGTVLGMKHSNMLDQNIWKIRILCGPSDLRYIYTQCIDNGYFDHIDACGSDVFETEEEVINIKIIPRSHYLRGDI